MNSHVTAKKPYLKPAHKHTRLIWARQHQQWEEEDWKHIIWTDEAPVEIGKGSERVWVWRRPGERHLDKCLIPTFKSGQQSLMIWGCIAYGRREPLICIPKDQKKGVDYINLVLGGPLLDFYIELSEESRQWHRSSTDQILLIHICIRQYPYLCIRQAWIFPRIRNSRVRSIGRVRI